MSRRELALLQQGIRHCDRCVISDEMRKMGYSPAPVEFKGTDCQLMIIGEAPGKTEMQKGRPFVGRAGMLMRALVQKELIDRGIDERTIAWANTVSCFPSKDHKVRQPTTGEIGNCRSWLEAQVSLLNPRYVLLAGATAFSAWRTDLSISKHHGYFGLWNGRPTIGTFHPASVLRGNEGHRDSISYDLESIYCVLSGMEWQGFEFNSCVRCSRNFDRRDRDGATYCDKHWKTEKTRWKREEDKWKVVKATTMQPKMF